MKLYMRFAGEEQGRNPDYIGDFPEVPRAGDSLITRRFEAMSETAGPDKVTIARIEKVEWLCDYWTATETMEVLPVLVIGHWENEERLVDKTG